MQRVVFNENFSLANLKMKWILCAVVIAAECLLEASCQKSGTAPECTAGEKGTISLYAPRESDNRTEGQVIVCEGERWRRICDGDGGWTTEDAQVACRELGFSVGKPVSIDEQTWTTDLPLVSSTVPTCSGSESTLANCTSVPLDTSSTDCGEIAVAVVCAGPLQVSVTPTIAVSPPESGTPVNNVGISTSGAGPGSHGSNTAVGTSETLSPTSSQQPSPSSSSEPSGEDDSSAVLSPVVLGLVGGGAVLIITTLLGIVLLGCIVITRRCRKTKVSMTGSRTAELEKSSGEIRQLGWSNPLATIESGPEYAELSTILTSPTTPQSVTRPPYSHSLTPGSSVDSSHEYEELHESIKKADEYKRAHQSKPIDIPEPYQNPQTGPAMEPVYGKLKQEDAYQSLQPFITTPKQLEKEPVPPPRDDKMYARLDHGRGLTFKPERRDHYPIDPEDRKRSASFDSQTHRALKDLKTGGASETQLDCDHAQHRRKKGKRRERGGREGRDGTRQYQNVEPSSRNAVERQRSESELAMLRQLQENCTCSPSDDKRSSLV